MTFKCSRCKERAVQVKGFLCVECRHAVLSSNPDAVSLLYEVQMLLRTDPVKVYGNFTKPAKALLGKIDSYLETDRRKS